MGWEIADPRMKIGPLLSLTALPLLDFKNRCASHPKMFDALFCGGLLVSNNAVPFGLAIRACGADNVVFCE